MSKLMQLATQKALFMAHQQYLLEQLFYLIGVLADKLGQGGEVRDGIAGQRLEDDVGLAASLDLAAGSDAFGASEQNDLQQDGGIVGQCRRCDTWDETPTDPACVRSGSEPRARSC